MVMQPTAELQVGGLNPGQPTSVGASQPVSPDQFDPRSICGQKGFAQGSTD